MALDDQSPLFGKLAAAKERLARGLRETPEREANLAHRLPPGQRLVETFPVLDLGQQPSVPVSEWSLTVDGAVDAPLTWSWDDFMAQPQTDIVTDIHCVTTWSRYDNRWTGVSARHLLGLARPKAAARFVLFKSFDGYTTNVPLERFADDDVLLAHSWQGVPLTREHGGPVRVVIPKLYFWKSAKWVRAVTFAENDVPGFWESRGYHNEGDPWKEQRFG